MSDTGYEMSVEDRVHQDRRKVLGMSNRVVRTPIGRLDVEMGRKKPRIKKYTPKKMLNAINRYLTRCEDRDELPTIKALTLYLKLSPSMFYTYRTYPEYQEIMESAYVLISDWVERDIYNTSGPAAGKIKYAMNILGWAEKIDQKTEIEHKTVMGVEQARVLIEAMAPQLLEMLGNDRIVAQIGTESVTDAEIIEPKQKEKRDEC